MDYVSRGWCSHGVLPGEYCSVCALEARIEAAWASADYYAGYARTLPRKIRYWWDHAWFASGITGTFLRSEPEPRAFQMVCHFAEERAIYIQASRNDVKYALSLEAQRDA